MTMIDFILNEKFLIPFLSTLGASLAIITGQQIFAFSARQRKRLYCIKYISDVALRLFHSNLIIKTKTVTPHIEATKRIIKGDSELLDIMFKTDEFDVLNGQKIEFNHLPEDYKLLVGYDSMKTLQSIEFLRTLSTDDSAVRSLNKFAKENLKSELTFQNKTEKEQLDILNTYWDCLDQVNNSIDRVNGFIANVFILIIEDYRKKFKFKLFSTKEISQNILEIQKLIDSFKKHVPDNKQMQERINQGIQKAL